MKRGTIEVELKGGTMSVPATISDTGLLAFHRQLKADGTESKRWTITHTKTGRVVKHCRLSSHCRAIVKALDEYVWELGVGFGDSKKKTTLEAIVDKIAAEVVDD